MTFETFDEGDDETLPDQQKTMTKTNTMSKTNTMTNTFREHPQRAPLDICDPRDTDYISDN